MEVILNNGISMPLIGLGVYDMYHDEAENSILYALQIGYKLVDTASMYENELQVGNAMIKSNLDRSDIFLTTKVNNAEQGYDKTLMAIDHSLKLLQTDYVDLYLVHWPLKATRIETWKALERIYAEGKAKAIGVANYLIPFLTEMYEYAGVIPAVNQVEFSPYLFLEDLMVHCHFKRIQLQAYTPLLRGLKFNDQKLVDIASKYKKSPAQIILRWCLQHKVSAIPKSSNPIRLKDNFDVFDFEISNEDMLQINSFNENFRVVDDPMSLY